MKEYTDNELKKILKEGMNDNYYMTLTGGDKFYAGLFSFFKHTDYESPKNLDNFFKLMRNYEDITGEEPITSTGINHISS